jgi:hypothetical protein
VVAFRLSDLADVLAFFVAFRLPDLAAGRVVAFRLPDLADVPAFFAAVVLAIDCPFRLLLSRRSVRLALGGPLAVVAQCSHPAPQLNAPGRGRGSGRGMPRLGAADADEKFRSLGDAIAVRHVRDNAHGSAGLSVDATDTCSQVHGDPPAHRSASTEDHPQRPFGRYAVDPPGRALTAAPARRCPEHVDEAETTT